MTVPLLAFLGTIALVIGGGFGALLTYRATRAGAKKDAENKLIDQLQEELAEHRIAANARATAQDERMNRLEPLVDGYRDYAHELRSHIFDGNPPPPPEWPKHLPR